MIDCGATWMKIIGVSGLCNKGITAAAYIGGWACAISGVCDIAYDCFMEAGDKKSCAKDPLMLRAIERLSKRAKVRTTSGISIRVAISVSSRRLPVAATLRRWKRLLS